MNIDSSFWLSIKSKLRETYEHDKLLKSWLAPIEYISTENTNNKEKLILGAPSAIQQYFANENLQEKIYQEILNTYHRPIQIEIIVSKPSGPQVTESTKEEPEQYVPTMPSPRQPSPMITSKDQYKTQESLNNEFTFGSFVVGKNSEFAHAACFNVAKNPGTGDYNPLYIYGPVGMGKTHLIHSAGNYIKDNFPHLRVIYLSAERFMNECISSIRRHEMDKFRQKYRENCDIFLVDDVQYIAKGEAVQEEFFHIINAFIDQKKQVILASDRMPKDIHGLEDRSRTRLERGLIADITMPDLETRIAILRYKAEISHVSLSDDVILYIARISKRSIRELEGNLKKVKIFSELQGLSINLELAKKILSNHESQVSISGEEIQKIVAEYYKIRMVDLKSSSRVKPIVVPRQIAMYLIKNFLDKSLIDIGNFFGGKDHTTVMNAIDRVRNLQATDQDIANDIEELEARIHNITGV